VRLLGGARQTTTAVACEYVLMSPDGELVAIDLPRMNGLSWTAATKGQVGRQRVFDGLLARLDASG
jgi:hypothetical protein